MKTTDFISEGIGEDATAMHQDHEVQMARQDCYNSAKNAIELHKLLTHINEEHGLEGWVSEKLTLAADYLKTVKEYLEYHVLTQHQEQQSVMPEFTFEAADQQLSESLADEFMAMAKAKGMNPRLRGTPDEERARTDAMLKQRAVDRANAPAPTKPQLGDDERAKLQAQLKDLESQFDSHYDYSDDYSYWTKQKAIGANIASIKNRLSESAGGMGAGSIATVPTTLGGGGKPGTGKPKKMGNMLKRTTPKIGTGIYK